MNPLPEIGPQQYRMTAKMPLFREKLSDFSCDFNLDETNVVIVLDQKYDLNLKNKLH